MNYKFTFKGFELKVPEKNIEIKLGEITAEVTDLNITDYVMVLKEVPALLREIKSIMQEDQEPITEEDVAVAHDMGFSEGFDKGFEAGKEVSKVPDQLDESDGKLVGVIRKFHVVPSGEPVDHSLDDPGF